jgi:hypothetical protein
MSDVIGVFIDANTDQIVERELTDEELSDLQQVQSYSTERQLEQEAKAKARVSALAKLKKLGLTDKEIAAL